MLLIHGLGASVATWRDNIAPLSEAFRVYAVDLPGHGDSDKPDIDYAADSVVRYLRDFVETLELDGQTAIIGSSVGGALALTLALDYPERFSRLVVVGSASLGREVSWYLRLASIPGIGSVLEGSRAGGTRFMLSAVFYDRRFVTQELQDELSRSRELPGAKEAVVRVIRNTVSLRGVRKQYVLLDRLGHLNTPLLVVLGAQDRIVPVSHAYLASKAVPNAWLQVFDQCGHWPHMEKATAFNSLVLRFLTQ